MKQRQFDIECREVLSDLFLRIHKDGRIRLERDMSPNMLTIVWADGTHDHLGTPDGDMESLVMALRARLDQR